MNGKGGMSFELVSLSVKLEANDRKTTTNTGLLDGWSRFFPSYSSLRNTKYISFNFSIHFCVCVCLARPIARLLAGAPSSPNESFVITVGFNTSPPTRLLLSRGAEDRPIDFSFFFLILNLWSSRPLETVPGISVFKFSSLYSWLS